MKYYGLQKIHKEHICRAENQDWPDGPKNNRSHIVRTNHAYHIKKKRRKEQTPDRAGVYAPRSKMAVKAKCVARTAVMLN
jgi:hypothetical protein